MHSLDLDRGDGHPVGGGGSAPPQHDPDPAVADVGHISIIEPEHRIAEHPREVHGVAGAHSPVAGTLHSPLGLEHIAVDGHGLDRLDRIDRREVDGHVDALAVVEAQMGFGREAYLMQLGRGDVATSTGDLGQREVGRQVLEVVPPVPALDVGVVGVEGREDDAFRLHRHPSKSAMNVSPRWATSLNVRMVMTSVEVDARSRLTPQ